MKTAQEDRQHRHGYLAGCFLSCWQAILSAIFSPSTSWPFIRGRPESRVIINGLDAAGKTTILYNLKLGEVVTTIPTIGFNVEQVICRNVTFTAWDVGGKDKIRPLWRHYFVNSHALIFVIDCNDRDRLEEAREELQRNLREEALQGVPLLVLANKQDLPTSVSASELASFLELPRIRDRKWNVQPCCATQQNSSDLREGLSWLATELHPRAANKKKYCGAKHGIEVPPMEKCIHSVVPADVRVTGGRPDDNVCTKLRMPTPSTRTAKIAGV